MTPRSGSCGWTGCCKCGSIVVVILAHLAAQDTRQDLPERQRAKLGLIRRLYDKGYTKERVLSLFRFIDWLLALPRAAEREVRHTIAQWEEEQQMPYITSVERLALEEGREEGLQAGREEGLQEGQLVAVRRSVQRVLERRFGMDATGIASQLREVQDLANLENVLDEAATATSLDQIRDLLATMQG